VSYLAVDDYMYLGMYKMLKRFRRDVLGLPWIKAAQGVFFKHAIPDPTPWHTPNASQAAALTVDKMLRLSFGSRLACQESLVAHPLLNQIVLLILHWPALLHGGLDGSIFKCASPATGKNVLWPIVACAV